MTLSELSGMEIAYWVSAIFGGTLFILRTALLLFGGGLDFGAGDGDVHLEVDHSFDLDHDLHHDVHTDVEVDHADADLSFKLLSFQGLTAFFMMFGLVGLAFTQSEVQASDTIRRIYEGRVTTDSSYKAMFAGELPRDAIKEYLISRDFTKVDNLVAIREYSVEHLAYGGGAFLKLDYDPRAVLEEQGFSHIYDCGTVSAFLPVYRPPPEK